MIDRKKMYTFAHIQIIFNKIVLVVGILFLADFLNVMSF